MAKKAMTWGAILKLCLKEGRDDVLKALEVNAVATYQAMCSLEAMDKPAGALADTYMRQRATINKLAAMSLADIRQALQEGQT